MLRSSASSVSPPVPGRAGESKVIVQTAIDAATDLTGAGSGVFEHSLAATDIVRSDDMGGDPLLGREPASDAKRVIAASRSSLFMTGLVNEVHGPMAERLNLHRHVGAKVDLLLGESLDVGHARCGQRSTRELAQGPRSRGLGDVRARVERERQRSSGTSSEDLGAQALPHSRRRKLRRRQRDCCLARNGAIVSGLCITAEGPLSSKARRPWSPVAVRGSQGAHCRHGRGCAPCNCARLLQRSAVARDRTTRLTIVDTLGPPHCAASIIASRELATRAPESGSRCSSSS